MKYIASLLLILVSLSAIATQNSDYLPLGEQQNTSVNWEDKKYTKKCITNSILEIKNIASLAKDIASQNYLGVAFDVKNVVSRGIKVITSCKSLFCYGPTYKRCEKDHPQGCEMWGAIVYPKCEQGYTNWDCCVCATTCPAGFTDNGLYCLKPRAYGRGVGYVLWKRDQCEKDYPKLGCEKNGALWYPKCEPGYHNVGCCICSPNCPEGWTDIGISCKKPHSYGRGVGYAVTFGEQCILDDLEEQKKDCRVQQGYIDYLQQGVNHKLDVNEELPMEQKYDDGVIDDVRELSQAMDKYADDCLPQEQQLE